MKEDYGFHHEIWRTLYRQIEYIASSHTRHPTKRINNMDKATDEYNEYTKKFPGLRPPYIGKYSKI